MFGNALTFSLFLFRYQEKRALKSKADPRQNSSLAPVTPFNMVFGTIPAFKSITAQLPKGLHPHAIATVYQQKHNLGPIYFLDNYPLIGFRQIVLNDPALMNQAALIVNTPRHEAARTAVVHIIGEESMLLQDDPEWKRSRTLFNPGFASGHLLSLMPCVIDKTMIFRQKLEQYAKSGEVFQCENHIASLTIDIIGKVVLDHDFNSQTEESEFVQAFRQSVAWSPSSLKMNIFKNWNPMMPLAQFWYRRKMNNYLSKVLEDRYIARTRKDSEDLDKRRGKPIVDLALDQYIVMQQHKGITTSAGTDPVFKRNCNDQLKTFILAGHDTTSSTLAFIFYLLDQHPDKRAKLMEEFDSVFGKDTSATEKLIREDPNIVNQLVYANSIIKETLRMFPPSTSARRGGTPITYNGRTYDTSGMMIWLNSHTMMRSPDYFPQPNDFIPERFLPAPNNWQDVPKDAWRAFERGGRSCIGQEFAMLEMKVIMSLTLREFVFEDGYEEWDRKLGREKPGEMLDGMRGAFGYRAYQVLMASAKPVDNMPLRVKRKA